MTTIKEFSPKITTGDRLKATEQNCEASLNLLDILAGFEGLNG